MSIFQWIRSKFVEEPIKREIICSIEQLSLDEILIKAYNNLEEIESAGFNSKLVTECCVGARTSFKGYKWRYNKIKWD